MKKHWFTLIVLAVLSLLPVWGNDSHATHFGKVAAQTTGNGTVYVSTSQSSKQGGTESAATAGAQSALTWSCGGSGENDSKTYYLFATPSNGYRFRGWSTSEGGTLDSTNPLGVSLKAESETENTPTTSMRYAYFELIPPSHLTFLAPQRGTYTASDGTTTIVDSGTIDSNLEITLTATPPDGWRVLGWYEQQGGVQTYFSYAATCTKQFEADATIGCTFIPESDVLRVSNYAELVDGLSSSSQMLEIPQGIDIVVPTGSTCAIPAGKMLLVAGRLAVCGELSINGALGGSGTVVKATHNIVQGEVHTPENAYTRYPSFNYHNTTVSACSPTITGAGTVGCDGRTAWGVVVDGERSFVTDVQSPKVLTVTFDAAIATNHIKNVTNAATSTTIDVNGDYLLLDNATVSGPIVQESSTQTTYTRLKFSGTIDCAAKTCTFTSSRQISSNTRLTLLNGKFSYQPSSEYWQNGQGAFINCTSITIKRIKNASSVFSFYDCNATITFSYYANIGSSDTASTANHKTACFYSGTYSYAFSASNDGSGMCKVYGGSFSNNPTDYLATIDLCAPKEGSYYVVQLKPEAVKFAKIGSTEYASLSEALVAATAGQTIELIANNTLTETLTVDKAVTIDLAGYNITGGGLSITAPVRFEDNSNYATKGTLSAPVAIAAGGSVDITYGTYASTVTLTGGTLTTHGGTFTAACGIVNNGGTVHLRGGKFAANVTSLLEPGFRQTSGNVGEIFMAGIEDDNPISAADLSFTVNALADPRDVELIKNYKKNNKNKRSDYTNVADWDRVAELNSALGPYESRAIEVTLQFDRDVAANSVTGYGKMGVTMNQDLAVDVPAGTCYRALSPLLTSSSLITYSRFLAGEFDNIGAGVKDNNNANKGTTCEVSFMLYSGNNGMSIGSRRFVFGAGSNTAMVQPATGASTFYATLAAGVSGVASGGTVKLCKACAETLTVAKECIVDANGFAFTGTLSAGTGYAKTDNGNGTWTFTATAPAAPLTVAVASGGSAVNFTIDAAWVSANMNGAGLGDVTAEQVKAVLEAEQANGLAKWQNDLLGVDGTVAANRPQAVFEQVSTDGTVHVKWPVALGTPALAAEGVRVSYELEWCDGVTAGSAWSRYGEPQATPDFVLAFRDVEGRKLFRIVIRIASGE